MKRKKEQTILCPHCMKESKIYILSDGTITQLFSKALKDAIKIDFENKIKGKLNDKN